MVRWSRRALIGTAAAAVGCAGLPTSGRSSAEPRAAPRTEGRLFLPAGAAEGSAGGAPKTPDTPDWQRGAAAVYLATPVTAGAVSLCFADGPRTTLPRQIAHFRELPDLLSRARELGSDILYVTDFYEGAAGSKPESYWTYKDDYVARSDLGGAAALRAAADAIRARGGRLVLYLSCFNVVKESPTGRAHGQAWSVKRGGVPLTEPYEDSWMPCPAASGWSDHLVAVARRIVGDYGADGIHLDTFGNMRGFRCDDPAHGHPPDDGDVFNEGCRAITERIRAAIREERPDAVVWCEGLKLQRLYGVLDASQSWGIHELASAWPALRAGSVDVFTAGWSLDDLHQILALGHKWMLADWWRHAPDGRCVDALAAALDTDRVQGDDRAKRYAAERGYRVLHRWRNAGLLARRRVPWIDAWTPRRWDREDLFVSDGAFHAHLGALRDVAAELDAIVRPADFASPAQHLGRLAGARRGLADLVDAGARVERAGQEADAVAWRFTSRKGVAVLCANVGDEAVDLDVAGRFVDVLDGARVDGQVAVPAHGMRLLRS